MAVDMTRYNPKRGIKGAMNRRSLDRYAAFWSALHRVGDAVVDAQKVAAKAADATPVKASKGRHWAAPAPDEMRSSAKKADRSLRVITAAAKKWEAELISREWSN